MDIAKTDKNFAVNSDLPFDDIQYYNCENSPIKIHGVFKENGEFRRLPQAVAKSVSEGVYSLHSNTAGGRLRFKTNSKYIALYTKMTDAGKMPHFALTGSAGFDLYVKENGVETYYKSFIPPFDISDGFESCVEFPDDSLKEVTINLPLYSSVSEVHIGIQKTAKLLPADGYKHGTPIVYYGSSITQGGCASRPGCAYQAIISRRFDADYINLGFSGNARAETEMIDYIKNLDMSVFVYDYDHNAPTVEHLEKTHEKGFLEIRKVNPSLPVIFMSRPKFSLTEEEKTRLEIIKTTYNNALKSGDKNVYFIDGKALMQLAGNEGTVDDCHPNDLGFYSMAKALGDVLENILTK